MATEALPFTLNRRSSEVLSESKSAAEVGLTLVCRYVPLEPIVPRRCESLPTVSRLPAVSAIYLGLAIRLAMDAAVVQLDRVDAFQDRFNKRAAAPTVLKVERLAAQRERMRERNVGAHFPGRAEAIDRLNPRAAHKSRSQKWFDGFFEKLLEQLRFGKVHEQVDALFGADFDRRDNRNPLALVNAGGAADFIVIGDRYADAPVAAESLDAWDAGDAVGIVRVNVSVDEQFRLLEEGG